MRLLLDTHILLWAGAASPRLPAQARDVIYDPDSDLLFSVVSIWEIAIKDGLGRRSFHTNAGAMRRGLLDNFYRELPVTGDHAVAVEKLPPIHKDPFDRILVAQATVEGVTLLTADPVVARYPGPVRLV